MPVPRFQPVKKKLKIMSATFEDLDDYCLSKIIGHALAQSCLKDDEARTYKDNRMTEQNLSLVCKKWYFITQTLIGTYGVHNINLDWIFKRTGAMKVSTGAGNKIKPMTFGTERKPALIQRNFGSNRQVVSKLPLGAKSQQVPQVKQPVDVHSLRLFRTIQPKLLKYKHIIFEGTLHVVEYMKLMVALDSARTERLELKIKIENPKSLASDFTLIPDHMPYLEELTLHWSSGTSETNSNGLQWIIYDLATCLRKLKIYLEDDNNSDNNPNNGNFVRLPPLGGGTTATKTTEPISIEQIANNFINSTSSALQQQALESKSHNHLYALTFNRTSGGGSQNCKYTSLLRNVLVREATIDQVNTNDNALIEHMIKSQDRVSTRRILKGLRFLTPIKNLDLLAQLLRSKSLGTDRLSIKIDTIDHIEEVRLHMENFKSNRHESSSSQISLYMKDQKFPDCEEKIRSLVSLSRLADVVVYISAQQRISIDCCHLMWSVGRHLQAADSPPGRCLFKITLYPQQNLQAPGTATLLNAKNGNSNSICEITIPFGKSLHYKLNTNREDLARHREICKSLKKDCYNQFVKSVRDQLTP